MESGSRQSVFSIFSRLRQCVRESLPIRIAGVFLASFLLLSFYFFLGTFTATDDQFFNIRLADILREQGFSVFQRFDWFAFAFPYPWISNLLFYGFLVPFTFVSPLEFGIKLYAVVTLSFTFSVLYYFFVTVRVRYAFFFTVCCAAVFLSWQILWHLLMARAFVVLPALLLLEIAFFVRGRYWAASLLAAAYFFWHTGTFFFPLLVAGAYALFSSRTQNTPDWRPFVSVGGGMAAAMIVGWLFIPGFGEAFGYTFHTIVKIVSETGLADRVIIDEGTEVYPTNLFNLYGGFPVLMLLLIVFCAGETARLVRDLRRKKEEVIVVDAVGGTLFFLSLLFLLGSFVTKRMVDFFVIIASVFVIYSLGAHLEEYSRKLTRPIVIGILLALCIALSSNMLLLADHIASRRHYALIRGAAEWLRDHTEEKEIIFNPTINFFPTFFFFNEGHNRLIVGLEPRNLFEYDAETYWFWYNVSNKGIVCGEEQCDEARRSYDDGIRSDADRWYRENGAAAASMIGERFSSRYIIVSKEFERFSTLLDKSESFEKVYETPMTGFFSVYRVLEH